MKTETYKYQRYLSAIFIIKLFEVLVIILLAFNVLFFNHIIKKSVFFNSLFVFIIIIWYSIALFKKYNFRFNTLVTFDIDDISVINGHKSETIKIDKNLEIWVLSSSSNSYRLYSPYMRLRNNTLIVIGNSENFKNINILPTRNITTYDNNIQHLEQPFGRGYISIIYREPLREWLNLYNKQIYMDQFPVASYEHLAQHSRLSNLSMHHYN